MKKFLTAVAIIAAATTITACGSATSITESHPSPARSSSTPKVEDAKVCQEMSDDINNQVDSTDAKDAADRARFGKMSLSPRFRKDLDALYGSPDDADMAVTGRLWNALVKDCTAVDVTVPTWAEVLTLAFASMGDDK